jgi:hypothetical protein
MHMAHANMYMNQTIESNLTCTITITINIAHLTLYTTQRHMRA